jgi:hypothetical protein
MNNKIIISILILFSGVLFFTGINWGLPSAKINSLYFQNTKDIKKTLNLIKKYRQKKEKPPRYLYNSIRSYHPDEYFVIKSLSSINPRKLNFNTHQFAIGGAYIYLLGVILLIFSKLKLIYLTKNISFYFFHPFQIAKFYIVGRILSGLYGIGIILFTYLLGTNLWNNKNAGFYAGILTALSPLVLLNSHYMYVDIPGLFWTMLALFLAVKFLKGKTNKFMPFLIGVACGIASGNKLTFVLSFLIPFFTFVLLEKNRFILRAKNVFFSFIGFILAFFITNPYFLNAFHQLFFGKGKNAVALSFQPNFYFLSLKDGLGLFLLIFLLAGIIFAFFKKEKEILESDKMLVLLWIVSFFVIMSFFALKFARYILPIIPSFIVLGIGFWMNYTNRKYSIVKKILLILVVFITFIYGISFLSLFIRNTRTKAGEWISQNLPGGTTIGVTEVPWQFQVPPLNEEKYKIKSTGYNIHKVKKLLPKYFLISSFQAPIPTYPVNLREAKKKFWKQLKKTNIYKPVKMWRIEPSFFGFTFKYKTMPQDLIYLNPTIILLKKGH